jgi:hypothetical protein
MVGLTGLLKNHFNKAPNKTLNQVPALQVVLLLNPARQIRRYLLDPKRVKATVSESNNTNSQEYIQLIITLPLPSCFL